jgi:hypothetical protein
MLRAVLGCGLAVVLAGTLGAAPAVAAPLDKGHFHDTFDITFDCDGTPTAVHGEVDVNFVFVKHGPGLAYYRESAHGTQVFTNLDTLGTLTEIFTVHSMDLKVIDNGTVGPLANTLTIIPLQTGSDRYYDKDGNFVLNDPGQIRSEILVPDNGTPDDPFDDGEGQFVSIVKGSTGRNDTQGRDFCEDIRLFT